MEKGIISLYPKECFETPKFQEQWQRYKNEIMARYGEDIDILFGDDYEKN